MKQGVRFLALLAAGRTADFSQYDWQAAARLASRSLFGGEDMHVIWGVDGDAEAEAKAWQKRQLAEQLRPVGFGDRPASRAIFLELRRYLPAYGRDKKVRVRPAGRTGMLFDLLDAFDGNLPDDEKIRHLLRHCEV